MLSTETFICAGRSSLRATSFRQSITFANARPLTGREKANVAVNSPIAWALRLSSKFKAIASSPCYPPSPPYIGVNHQIFCAASRKKFCLLTDICGTANFQSLRYSAGIMLAPEAAKGIRNISQNSPATLSPRFGPSAALLGGHIHQRWSSTMARPDVRKTPKPPAPFLMFGRTGPSVPPDAKAPPSCPADHPMPLPFRSCRAETRLIRAVPAHSLRRRGLPAPGARKLDEPHVG